MGKNNREFQIDVQVNAEKISETLTKALNDGLGDKAFGKLVDKKIQKQMDQLVDSFANLGEGAKGFIALNKDGFDVEQLAQYSAMLSMTNDELKDIYDMLLNLGAVSLEDLNKALKVVLDSSKRLGGALSSFKDVSSDAQPLPLKSVVAFKDIGEAETAEYSKQINELQKEKEILEKTKDKSLAFEDLFPQKIKPDTTIAQIKNYYQQITNAWAKEANNLDAETNSLLERLVAGENVEEENNTLAKKIQALNLKRAQYAIAFDNLLKGRNESKSVLDFGPDPENSFQTFYDKSFSIFNQDDGTNSLLDIIEDRIKSNAQRLDVLEQKKQEEMQRIVALGASSEEATNASAPATSALPSEDQKKYYRLSRQRGQVNAAEDRFEIAQEATVNRDKIPNVISDLETDTEYRRQGLQRLLDRIKSLNQLQDPLSEEFKSFYTFYSDLNADNINIDEISNRANNAYWNAFKVIDGKALGAEAKYKNGETISKDDLNSYLKDARYLMAVLSAVEAGVIKEIKGFRTGHDDLWNATGVEDLNVDQIREKLKPAVTELLQKAYVQIATRIGKAVDPSIIPDIAKDIIDVVPTETAQSTPQPSKPVEPVKTEPTIALSSGSGSGAPPNTLKVNVIYTKTTDQLKKELLEVLKQLQILLDNNPLSMSFEGFQDDSLPDILKTLSKKTHTITVRVDADAADRMTKVVEQVNYLVEFAQNKVLVGSNGVSIVPNEISDGKTTDTEVSDEKISQQVQPVSAALSLTKEQIASFTAQFNKLFESKDGVNYFEALNAVVQKLNESLDILLQQLQKVSEDSDAADSLWVDVQNASHKLFQKSSHKDAIGDVSQYKLIDRESEAYKKQSEVVYELYDRYKALGGVKDLSDIVEDEWFSLNDKVKAPGSADLNKLEQEYADRAVRQINGEGITKQFEELLSILNRLVPKFTELLELYKTINRVADENTLASKWSEVQKNMLKIVNSKGEIDYGKKGFTDLAATFYESYREYRDLGGTLDFNALRMHDTSKLKPDAYDSMFKDYSASKFSPSQTLLGGVDDFISKLGTGANEASANIELLESKIKNLENTLQTSNSVSDFFKKLTEALEPAKGYFNELTDKIKSIGTQQQDVKIDTKAITEPYEKLADVLEGVKNSLSSILELYKTVNGFVLQWELDYQWKNLQDMFNGRGRYSGHGLLNARGSFDPNKNADEFFQMFSKYRRSGAEKGIARLTRGEDNKPITQVAVDNLASRYQEYEARQEAQAQAPISIDLTAIENTINTIQDNISKALAEIKSSVASLPSSLSESLKAKTSTEPQNLSEAVAQAVGAASSDLITSLGRTIVNELTEHLDPLLSGALEQMIITRQHLDDGNYDSLRNTRSSAWFRQFSREGRQEREIESLTYDRGKYRGNPIVLKLGGNLRGLPEELPEAQEQIGNNLSKQGIQELLRIADIYDEMIKNERLRKYDAERTKKEPDFALLRQWDADFEALRVSIENFLKNFNQGKYALNNSKGSLLDRGDHDDFIETPEEATGIIKELISAANTPDDWRRANGGKFIGNFTSEGNWNGIGTDSSGRAQKVTYTYDPFNKDIRRLQVDLPKDSKRNRRAIIKQQRDFKALQTGFEEDNKAKIAGVSIKDIKSETFSGKVLGVVTQKIGDLEKLRKDISDAFSEKDWDEFNSKVALGIISKTDVEYKRFQRLLDLLDKYKAKTKEVKSLIGSSNGTGWLSNNKGTIKKENVRNVPTDINSAIEEVKTTVQNQYPNASELKGKLAASGQSYSGQLVDAAGQVHDITIAYDEATQSVRAFDQVNQKATNSLQKNAQTQADSVTKAMDEVVQISQGRFGGVSLGSFGVLKNQVTTEAQTTLSNLQDAWNEYNKLIKEAEQNNTTWSDVAILNTQGNTEPFSNAYANLKKLLSLSKDIQDFAKILEKILAPGSGSGWLNNTSGQLMGLSGAKDLSPVGAASQIEQYLSAKGWTDVKIAGDKESAYDSNTGTWTYTGLDKNNERREITIKVDVENNDLRLLSGDVSNVEKGAKKAEGSIVRLNLMGDQMFNTFKRVATTLTPLVTVINSATQAFQNGYNTLVDYDKALTNISYTMTLSKQQLQDLGQATIDMAKDLNLSISDAMSVAQIYANMQTTPEEIVELSRPTAILANLSGQNTETAANYVQSVIEQFGMTEEDAMHIVDVYDTVSANIKMDYAKGIGVIASATEAAGQVAKDAGL